MIRDATKTLTAAFGLLMLAGGCMVPQSPMGGGNTPAPAPAGTSGPAQWPMFTNVTSRDAATAAPKDDPNIIGVRKFIAQEPWLSFSKEGLRQADGFKATLYLESGTSGKGAFGDGIIRISMYTVEPDTGGEHLRLAVQWELAPEQTLPWRVKKATRLGWGYGLRLPWGDADVSGHEVEVSFQFLRKDGAIISAEPVRLRVPPRSVRIVTRDEAPAASQTGQMGARPVTPKSLASSP